LWAVAFDLRRREVGTPVPVSERVMTTTIGFNMSISSDGTLVYVPGGVEAAARALVWVDRQGREEPLKAPLRAYMYPRLSPDGTRVALDVRDQDQDIWIWDLARETLRRFTFDPAEDQFPVWTPDGRRLLFNSTRAGPADNLFWQASDGTGAVERLTESPNKHYAYSVSPDGTRLVFSEETAPTWADALMVLTLDGRIRGLPSPGPGRPGRSSTSTLRQAEGVVSPRTTTSGCSCKRRSTRSTG
jgi:serine/threonine-protein kinase